MKKYIEEDKDLHKVIASLPQSSSCASDIHLLSGGSHKSLSQPQCYEVSGQETQITIDFEAPEMIYSDKLNSVKTILTKNIDFSCPDHLARFKRLPGSFYITVRHIGILSKNCSCSKFKHSSSDP